MTAKEILDRLSKGYQTYLNGDVTPVEGYDDKFYNGVLWAYARLTEIQPSIKDLIDNALTVEERPEGKWIYEYDDFYHCSICGRVICTEWDKLSLKNDFPFCHCGADMKGGAENEKVGM